MAAEDTRRRLMARRGYAEMIKSSPMGAADFGKNASVPQISAGTARNTGGMA